MTLHQQALPAAARAPATFLDPSTFPDIYGMSVSGSCMAPLYPDGCKVKISKSEPYTIKDIVVVWFRPELLKPDGVPALIKRIGLMPPPWVKAFPYKETPKSEVGALMMLEQNDRPGEWLTVRCTDVIAVHKVLGLLADGESYKASKEQFMRKAPRRRRAVP